MPGTEPHPSHALARDALDSPVTQVLSSSPSYRVGDCGKWAATRPRSGRNEVAEWGPLPSCLSPAPASVGSRQGSTGVRTGRGLGHGLSRDAGETQRGSKAAGPAAHEGREPVFPGLSPFSTCFSSLLFLFKCHSLGEITEPSLSIIRVKGIRKGLGFQSSHCPEDAGLTPLLPAAGLPLLPCGCGWLSNAGPRGPCTFLPELSSLQLSLSQLAASPRSPTQCHSAKPSSQQPDNPELSQAQAVSVPRSFQAVAPDS